MENVSIITEGFVNKQIEGDQVVPFDHPAEEARKRLIGRGYICVSPPTQRGNRTVEVWSRRPRKEA